jgi:hypothetical protein
MVYLQFLFVLLRGKNSLETAMLPNLPKPAVNIFMRVPDWEARQHYLLDRSLRHKILAKREDILVGVFGASVHLPIDLLRQMSFGSPPTFEC